MNVKDTRPGILIIDDDSMSSMAIEGLLSSEPYDLFFEFNGSDGIAAASALHPDLILLDVMMPLMDGYEVCKRIRALPDIAEVPILLITARPYRPAWSGSQALGYIKEQAGKHFDPQVAQAFLDFLHRQ